MRAGSWAVGVWWCISCLEKENGNTTGGGGIRVEELGGKD